MEIIKCYKSAFHLLLCLPFYVCLYVYLPIIYLSNIYLSIITYLSSVCHYLSFWFCSDGYPWLRYLRKSPSPHTITLVRASIYTFLGGHHFCHSTHKSKIVKMAQCKIKQGPQGFKLIIQDLFREGVIIPTTSPSWSPIWPVLEVGNNRCHDISTTLIPWSYSLRPPHEILLKLLTPSINNC